MGFWSLGQSGKAASANSGGFSAELATGSELGLGFSVFRLWWFGNGSKHIGEKIFFPNMFRGFRVLGSGLRVYAGNWRWGSGSILGFLHPKE